MGMLRLLSSFQSQGCLACWCSKVNGATATPSKVEMEFRDDWINRKPPVDKYRDAFENGRDIPEFNIPAADITSAATTSGSGKKGRQ